MEKLGDVRDLILEEDEFEQDLQHQDEHNPNSRPRKTKHDDGRRNPPDLKSDTAHQINGNAPRDVIPISVNQETSRKRSSSSITGPYSSKRHNPGRPPDFISTHPSPHFLSTKEFTTAPIAITVPAAIRLVPQHAASARRSRPFDGFIFSCNQNTFDDCMKLGLFGGTEKMMALVSEISPFDTPLFLFHLGQRAMYGVFEATSHGRANINPFAWSRQGEPSPFPAQVTFRYKYKFLPLPESVFMHLLNYRNGKFAPTLNRIQCRTLIDLFAENDAKTARRAADQLVQFFHL